MPIFRKKQNGFTLMELLLIMGIVGIMSAVILATISSSKDSSRLKAAQREVASTIKLAQTYALQGKNQGSVIACGYGFRFTSSTSYEIFYNIAGNPPTNYSDCKDRNDQANGRRWFNGLPNSSIQAETHSLKNGVTLDTGFSPVLDTEFYFTVPHATIYDRQGQVFSGSQTFRFVSSGNTKDITINSGGYVSESQ